MKKVLVVLLALAVLLSLSGAALADFRSITRTSPSGATVWGDINKTIKQETEATSRTGIAAATGNTSGNTVTDRNSASAINPGSVASNTNTVTAGNAGGAGAATGDAAAANSATNAETDIITDVASATVECNFTKLACDRCGCPGHDCCANNETANLVDGHRHTCDKCETCECCPATVKGDINIRVEQKTTADATSGDALATGNSSANLVNSCNNATAVSGTATNSNSVTATNSGTALAASGAASSSNIVNNSVYIDILRQATTSRTINKFLQY
ncbi:MAG: hypothetical protein A2074_05635 [Candidatus Aquicultor primus]|uniref:Uncharacterized protein n=1 Tax=Candidatus Aquicultor primus TaxID=1797195 RepID=A0A1F2ULG7_9ACTN|nr:MAG: hypothetical protein A2074_05635 [Candidatus Aquicultor primus]HCG98390.1 hypothetical protein [Actinomycetota bacterium]